MLVSGIAQSGQNLALSRLANITIFIMVSELACCLGLLVATLITLQLNLFDVLIAYKICSFNV